MLGPIRHNTESMDPLPFIHLGALPQPDLEALVRLYSAQCEADRACTEWYDYMKSTTISVARRPSRKRTLIGMRLRLTFFLRAMVRQVILSLTCIHYQIPMARVSTSDPD